MSSIQLINTNSFKLYSKLRKLFKKGVKSYIIHITLNYLSTFNRKLSEL